MHRLGYGSQVCSERTRIRSSSSTSYVAIELASQEPDAEPDAEPQEEMKFRGGVEAVVAANRMINPRNPCHFVIIESGRVYLTWFVRKQCFVDIF